MPVQCKNVIKKFGTLTAVNQASFQLTKGECFGLLGPNGAGKSTLIKILYGAIPRNGGELKVFSYDPATHAREIKKRLGVVTQDNHHDEAMTAIENMTMYCRFHGMNKKSASMRVDELMDFMNLAHKKNVMIRALSGGMQRRLAFVRALLPNPDLLILDEPTTGLDPAVRQLLWQKVNQLKSEGKTVILTTHYMDEAEKLCDRLIIMDQGGVKEEGTPRELIDKHCPGFIAQFPDGRPDLKATTLNQLTERVAGLEGPAPLMRPSNLEDVFLTITGRELGQNA